jgi:hypothetical protein
VEVEVPELPEETLAELACFLEQEGVVRARDQEDVQMR